MTPTALLAALQLATLDQGALVVRQDTTEIARETFHLRQGRLSNGATGWILTATSQYGPDLSLSPILELGGDSLPVTLQYDVAHPARPQRILGQAGRSRFVLRYVTPRSERAREIPIAGRTVVLDDSVFSFYAVAAWFAQADPVPVTAIVPLGARRESLVLTDRGTERILVNGDPTSARHLSVTGGAAGPVEVWVDARTTLLKVEIRARRITAERLP